MLGPVALWDDVCEGFPADPALVRAPQAAGAGS
jgi:hypothetical protein